MGLFYTKKKDDDENAIDFMEVMEAQIAVQNSIVGETVAPLPYDVQEKTQIEQQIEVEQRPK